MLSISKHKFIHLLPTIVLLVIGAAVAYEYYQQQVASQINKHVLQYEYQSQLRHQQLKAEIDEKQQLLDLIARHVDLAGYQSPDDLSYFVKDLIAQEAFDDLCLIIPNEGQYLSIKEQQKTDYCANFDLLRLNKLVSVKENPALYLAKSLNKQQKHVYIAMVISLKNIAKLTTHNDFDEYFSLFNTGNLESHDFSLHKKNFNIEDKLNLAGAIKQNYFDINRYGEIKLIYTSLLTNQHLPSIWYQAMLNAVLVFSLFVMIAIYLFRLVINKLQSEKATLAVSDELSFSQEFLKLIISNIPDYIFVKDKDFKITYANEEFLSLYPKEQQNKVIGYTTVERYQPEEAGKFLEKDRQAFAEGYSETNEKLVFPDGETRVLATKKIRFQDSQGAPNIIGIARDVTERETLITKLKQSNEELQAFAYRTSHDLKAPLISIKRLCDFVLEDIDQQKLEESKKNIRVIKDQSQQLSQLVVDILDLSRVDVINDEKEKINFDRLITSILDRHQPAIQAHQIEVNTHIALHGDYIGQQVRLNQVLDNLITNTIKYYDPDKAVHTVDISVTENNKMIEINVIDNGIGFPDAYIDNVFTVFKRFHPRVAEGNGIGLSIVKKHVEKMHGTIELLTNRSPTTFRIRIPMHV